MAQSSAAVRVLAIMAILVGWPATTAADRPDPSARIDYRSADPWIEGRRDPASITEWPTVRLDQLLAADAAEEDWFGGAVAISGDRIVVGAERNDSRGLQAGAAYVFERNGGADGAWMQAAKLQAWDGEAFDYYGNAVAIDGGTVVVGARAHGNGGGAAYVYERQPGGGWLGVRKLTASDGVEGAWFGSSVAVDGDTIVVGAELDQEIGPHAGAAYVFARDLGGTDQWDEVVKLIAADTANGDRFGGAVSISGDRLVVGSAFADATAGDSGAAYVFERDARAPGGWSEVATLIRSDEQTSTRFGASLSIAGDTIVVGSVWDDALGEESGSAYVFERNVGGPAAWGRVAQLVWDGGDEEDWFGVSVSIDGDTIAVGADRADPLDPGDRRGAVFVFHRNTGGADGWGQVVQLTTADGIGESVAVDGDTLVAGTITNHDGGLFAGTAYVYGVGGCDWAEVAKPIAADAAEEHCFGVSIAIDESTAAVGSTCLNEAVYLFERNAGGPDHWGQVRRLVSPTQSERNRFGWKIALDGDTLVVGASLDDSADDRAGAAFVFERNAGGSDQWGHVATLTAMDADLGDQFGVAVAVSDDTIVVGALDREAGNDAGAAYVFERHAGGPDNWGQVHKLLASDGFQYDAFGTAAAIHDDTIVIGAYGKYAPDREAGAAYVFERDAGGAGNWGEVAALYDPQPTVLGWFGYSVAIDGDTVLVGAPHPGNPATPGRAYAYSRDAGGAGAWGEVAALTATDPSNGDRFGESVSVGDGTITIGAAGSSDLGYLVGSAYVFERDPGGSVPWSEATRLVAADAKFEDQFGTSIGIDGNSIIVGAYHDGHAGSRSGSSYVFEFSCFDCGDDRREPPAEQCDDGNVDDWDGCSGECRIEPCIDRDGDGFGEFGEPACPSGTTPDCDDLDAERRPGWGEVCDGKDNDCDGLVDENQAGAERERFTFDTLSLGFSRDPAGWFDTGPNDSLQESDLFYARDVADERTFGTGDTGNHVHSHFTVRDSHLWTNYTYSGRFRIDDPDGGIGFTVLSDYPNSNTYYYLRRNGNDPELRVRTHGLPFPDCTPRDTNLDPLPDRWYRFALRVDVDGVQTTIRASAWGEDETPPTGWQVTCVDATPQRRTAGTFGVWGFGPGGKYFDDVRVVANTGAVCGSDVGECSFGLDVCDGGLLVCDGTTPQPEICDGLDNDCDGAVPVEEIDTDADGLPACALVDAEPFVVTHDPGAASWTGDARLDGWNAYVGDLAELVATGTYTQLPGDNDLAQRSCGLTEPTVPLPALDDAGALLFVLVTTVEDGHEGSLGLDGTGTLRPNTAPCP